MTRRSGMTMTEVLVAIFVVAIGLAGVMSMVPFGAKQMSDALVADRATSHATTIDGMVRPYWKEKIVEDTRQDNLPPPPPPNPASAPPPRYFDQEPFFIAMDDPGRGLPKPTAGPSYPVFLDPMGVVGRRGQPGELWVGDGGSTNVPRRTMNGVQYLAPFGPYLSLTGMPNTPSGLNRPNPQEASTALRMWSQPDGFSWDEDSRPVSGPSMREYRYNALAVIQRPTNSARYTATLKVVVFSNRRHLFFPSNGPEVKFTGVNFVPTLTTIQLPTSAEVQKGSWIMDATVDPNANGTLRHANFYRVVSAVENTPGTFDIELHTPITRVDGQSGAYAADIVVMPGVAGVFERPQLTDQ
ncbi:MAG TPA: prepilin-type N-terminal cleavage/methylation domain-containing protein [Gemmata sp.]